ncbi:MAG TPA: hypothetical protein VGG33_04060 [Polyangia bacterium]
MFSTGLSTEKPQSFPKVTYIYPLFLNKHRLCDTETDRLDSTRGQWVGKTAAICVPDAFRGQQEGEEALLQVLKISGILIGKGLALATRAPTSEVLHGLQMLDIAHEKSADRLPIFAGPRTLDEAAGRSRKAACHAAQRDR